MTGLTLKEYNCQARADLAMAPQLLTQSAALLGFCVVNLAVQ